MNARSVGAFVFLALLLWADTGHAGWAACDSAGRKESPDEQIRLYTLCITNGQIRRQSTWPERANRQLPTVTTRMLQASAITGTAR